MAREEAMVKLAAMLLPYSALGGDRRLTRPRHEPKIWFLWQTVDCSMRASKGSTASQTGW